MQKLAFDIIDHFYPAGDPAREILLKHSTQVCRKALQILDAAAGMPEIDRETVICGALLHDVGIRCCNAPDIGCSGKLPYLTHGVAGAEMLRSFGRENGVDLEKFARICERHTGTGLSAAEIRTRKLPLPERDFIPETAEEKLVCLADKFYSKSADFAEKDWEKVCSDAAKFGAENLARLIALQKIFL